MSAIASSRLGPLRHRDYRLLFLGRTISTIGGSMAPVALAFAILNLGGGATELGIVLAARQIPQVLFLLFGGVFGDRLPRHRVMVGSGIVSGASQTCVAALILTGRLDVVPLAVFAGINGVSSAFSFPASMGIIPQTVPPEDIQPANVLLRLANNVCSIFGPVVAGVLVAAIDPGWTIVVDAISFWVGAAFVARVDVPETLRMHVGSIRADLREGWDEFRSRTWLWAVVVQFGFVNAVAGGVLYVLGPAIAKERLGGAPAYGAIMAAMAAGFVAGGLVNLRWRPRRILLVATIAVFVDALPPLAFAFAPAAALVAAVMVLRGLCLETFGVMWSVVNHEQIPPEKLARVTSYDALGSFVLMPLGSAGIGPLVDRFGTRPTLVFCSLLVVAATAPVLLVRDIRTMTRRLPAVDAAA